MKMTSLWGKLVLPTENAFGNASQNRAFSNCQHLELRLAAKHHVVLFLLHVSHISNKTSSTIKPELAFFVMTHGAD